MVDSKAEASILIVAAEASSCMYAKKFMAQWSQHFPETHYFGVGDKQMQSQGMSCQGLAEDLAVVGLQEVISHWSEIKQTFHSILEEADRRKPDFALLLDYPGFNLRLAKKLKAMGIPVVYYISPQLWAWKKGRVSQVRQFVDDMMVVFPFEVDFYKKHDVKAHFVGHPLVEVVEDETKELEFTEKTRPVLGLMPGSRKSEIKFNFFHQLKAAKILKNKHDIDVKVLVAPTLNVHELKTLAGELATGVEFVQSYPTAMIQQCDYILSASGTATLQVALCEKPMVVMYRMNSLTALLAKLLVRSVDAFCIVNLIAGKKIVPERFQSEAEPEKLAGCLEKIIVDREHRERMLKDIQRVKTLLGKGGATENLVSYLREKYRS